MRLPGADYLSPLVTSGDTCQVVQAALPRRAVDCIVHTLTRDHWSVSQIKAALTLRSPQRTAEVYRSTVRCRIGSSAGIRRIGELSCGTLLPIFSTTGD